MKLPQSLSFCTVLIALLGCTHPAEVNKTHSDEKPAQANKEALGSNKSAKKMDRNKVAINYSQKLEKLYPDSNLFFSPYSIDQTLQAFAMGQKDPNHAMLQHFFVKPDAANSKLASETAFSVANNLWLDTQLKANASYRKQYTEKLKGMIKHIDFKNVDNATNEINSTVAKVTQNKIPSLVSKNQLLNAEAVFTNAVYFKAPWKDAFEKHKTTTQPFLNLDNTTVSVDTMLRDGTYDIALHKGWTLVKVPFESQADKPLVLSLFLPPDNNHDAQLTLPVINDLEKNAASEKILISLPKFNFTSPEIDLNQLVPEIQGLQLDNMLVGKSLNGMQALHKANITWDETGAEASAASAAIAKRSFVADNIKHIKFSRTFHFHISSGEDILFAGLIKKMSKEQPRVRCLNLELEKCNS